MRLAPGTKAKTKRRTITPAGKTAFRYKLAKSAARGESVRLVVAFGKGKKVMKSRTIRCAVRIGKAAMRLEVSVSGGGAGTVSSTPGGIACEQAKSPCKATYTRGTKVRLTAAPGTDSDFKGWGGACSGTGQCVVTVNAARTVTASFAKKRFSVTIQKAGEGGGTVTSTGSPLNCGAACSATFEAGTVVRLRAEPDAKSRFVGWTGVCSSTATQCIFTVDAETTVTATFALKGFRLAVSRAGTGDGTISADSGGVNCPGACSATYDANVVVTLTATSAPGSLFEGWTGECQASGPTCVATMSAARFIAATFTLGVTITVSINGDFPAGQTQGTGTGTVVSNPPGISCSTGNTGTCSALFLPGVIVRLAAQPDTASGSSFSYWYRCAGADDVQPGPGNCEGTGAELAGRTIVAHFLP